jgi:transposase-like protein
MSKRQTNSNSDRRQFWQMVIETWQNSGMSVAKFCRAEGFSEGAFYNWRKKLSVAALMPDESSESSTSGFIKVSLPKNEHTVLELELSSGNILRIHSGADNKTLSSVLSILHEVGLC